PAAFAGGAATVGVDVARRRDLWVAAVFEQVGDVLWLREMAVQQGIPFSQQRAIVGALAARYRPVRIAVDQTGMGEAVVEQLQEDLGRTVVEGVLMTGPRRLDVATALREAVEDRRLRIPPDAELRRDLHAVRAEAGPTGAPRLLAERSGTDGHADRFWALALACTAARDGNATVEGASAGPRAASLAGFY
ncbi:MAG: terminase, partial [Rhodospirillales bacterium]|nr:terminase [Rhodospirillales bacterium]